MYGSGSAGFAEILPGIIGFIFFVAIIGGVARKAKGGVSLLVLKKFMIDSTMREPIFIDIQGRKPGLVSWFLALIGIDPTEKLLVSKDEVVFEEASLSGETTYSVPVRSISATLTGFRKPWELILIAVVFGLMAIISLFIRDMGGTGFIIFVVLAVIFVVAYALNKKIMIAIESRGGRTIGMAFKPSVIEGITINIEKAKETMKIVREISK